jgi:hypothetical protein
MTTEPIVIIHGDPWNLADIKDNIAWAKTINWTRSKWKPNAKLVESGWKHDHCGICWWTLGASEKEAEGTGYTDQSSYNWLCLECYDLFVKDSAASA